MKECTKCRKSKPESFFSKDKTYGLKHHCKECVSEYNRIKYSDNRDRMIKTASEWGKKNKEKIVEVNKRYRKKHPNKQNARNRFRNAVISGKIIPQSCEICGNTEAEGHHEDYSKPFEVRWLCSKHHGEEHRKTL